MVFEPSMTSAPGASRPEPMPTISPSRISMSAPAISPSAVSIVRARVFLMTVCRRVGSALVDMEAARYVVRVGTKRRTVNTIYMCPVGEQGSG